MSVGAVSVKFERTWSFGDTWKPLKGHGLVGNLVKIGRKREVGDPLWQLHGNVTGVSVGGS